MTNTTATRRHRFAASAAACVGLGVVTTVVVALGFAAWKVPAGAKWSRKFGDRAIDRAEGYGTLSAHCESWHGFRRYQTDARSYSLYGSFSVTDTNPPEDIPPRRHRDELLPWCFAGVPWPRENWEDSRVLHVCGWPLGAISCGMSYTWEMPMPSMGVFETPPRDFEPLTITDIHGWTLPPSLAGWFPNTNVMGTALLPTRPIWPGLLADTAFYGVLWAAALFGPRRVKRWIRIRRGHCPLCGYDRKGLAREAPCPECGGSLGAMPPPEGVTARAR